MGIRFACHVCEKQLNIKRDLAGRRGVCPACSARFRIPSQDAETSVPIESAVSVSMVSQADSQPNETLAIPTETIANATHAPAMPDADASSADLSGNMIEDALADLPVGQAGDRSTSLLDEDPSATWYVRPPSGGQYGPATSEILKEWIDQGRVASTALLWRDGWPQWREASETLPELAQRLPNGNVATRSPSPVAPAKLAPASPQLSGQSTVGSERRSRSGRRVLLIGVLAALAVTLIGVLVFVVSW